MTPLSQSVAIRGHWVADRLEELSEEIDELLREAELADEVPFGAGSATQDALSSLGTAIRRWRR